MIELSKFHPVTAKWFEENFEAPTPPQIKGWPKILTGEHTLIAAPTGMGKTLTAFFCFIDKLFKQNLKDELQSECQILYVSPLKALGNDIQKNLTKPLEGIGLKALEMGFPLPDIKVSVRSGDTTQKERRDMLVRPPHILITTPESLHILLCAEKSRDILKNVKTVIIDEIHAVSGDKRGAHLSLCLERLERLTQQPLQRIGLSATQKPIERMANVLVGERFNKEKKADCHIVDVGSHRKMDLNICIGDDALGPIATHEYWAQIYEMILKNIEDHETTIIFTHTRRLVERISHQLSERLGKDKVAAHHGSLSKEARLDAEQKLKAGEIPVVVASASLELGIDIGSVDLVIHLGAPRMISSLLQRIGRSGHITGKVPKGIVYPLTIDELIQSAAAVRAVKNGDLDAIVFQKNPLDILSQIIVAESAVGEISLDELWNLVKMSYYFKDLKEKDFNEVLSMLSEGITTARGRSSAYIHFDRVNHLITGRRNARLAVITSGGTIPEAAEYDVVQEPDELFIGRVNEDFAIESMAGNIFLLGNRSWRITRVEKNRVRVVDAEGAPPNIPFWFGEAPSRTLEMSKAVADLREYIADHIHEKKETNNWIQESCNLSEISANQITRYIEENLNILGAVPTMDTLIAERFFDESGGMQLIMHTPFGGRVNRAWALAMRKRFCLTFDFELQCAATDDGLIFSLGEQHSFPLETVWHYLHVNTLQKDLTNAVLPHPIFMNRFRWNATRSLAVLRFQGGKKVPIHLQRMKSDDLLASVFPAHVGCQDNRTGPIEPVDHPLVNETLENCFHEAMDLEGLKEILENISINKIKTLSVDTTTPSPFSHEILNAAPYAFLDDAPLEERRARAVQLRRFNPDDELGKLDPEIIGNIVGSVIPEFRNSNELQDFLITLGLVDYHFIAHHQNFIQELQEKNRLSSCEWSGSNGRNYRGWVTSEKWHYVSKTFQNINTEFQLPKLILLKDEIKNPTQQDAINFVIKGWVEILGPVTEEEIQNRFGFTPAQIQVALAYLEGMGLVLQGKFSSSEKQWCSRVLLQRIHYQTIQKLRKQVEPVTQSDYMRFLFRWQHIHPDSQLAGPKGIMDCISQLQGVEAPLSAWEEKILKLRIKDFQSYELENLFLNGQFQWCRMSKESPENLSKDSNPHKNFNLAILNREEVIDHIHYSIEPKEMVESLTGVGKEIYSYLIENGASFLGDISRGIRQLNTSIEDGLKTLIGHGLISTDGISGLKKLIFSNEPNNNRGIPKRFQPFKTNPGGRWYIWKGCPQDLEGHDKVDVYVRQLLLRYGILLKEVTLREHLLFPWWQILMSLRKMEARGEIRGGRFIKGISGEQFALPEALEALKPIRNRQDDHITIISSSDPLNLVGIIVPGEKVPTNSNQYIAFKGGNPIECGLLIEVKTKLKNAKRITPT